MPRLPIPGQDAGTWGNLLNDYLSATHKGDGTLKDNVVTNAALATDAVNSDSIAAAAEGNDGYVLTYDSTAPSKMAWKAVSGTSVTSVAGRTGAVTLTAADVGLANVDNTSDASKPISSAVQTALNAKLDASQKGAASGVASLDASSKLTASQLPALTTTNLSDFTEATQDLINTTIKAGTNVTVAYDDTAGTFTINSTATTAPTNLGNTPAASTLALTSSTGTGTTLPAATTTLAGVLTAADKTKLDGIAAGATANATDAQLRDRSTHTGTQTASTISDFNTAADARITAQKGANNGLATLDGTGKVPSAQLPSYVDDVLEYANQAAFPATGTTGIIYVAQDTNRTYRWSGSAYVNIAASPGSTDAVPEGSTNLYYTNARASAAAPVQSVAGRTGAVTLTKADVGLANVDNTSDANKPVSTATQTALNGKANTTHTHAIADVTNLQTTLDGKMPIPTQNSAVAMKDAGGVVGSLPYSVAATADSIVRRGALGVIDTGTPTAPAHAATKAYVDSTTTSKDYIASRGQSLVTNGQALLGTNYNFTSFTLDKTDRPVGATGSFVGNGTGAVLFDEYMAIDPKRTYAMRLAVKQGVTDGARTFYSLLAAYDTDKNLITPDTYMEVAGTRTTLAADLKTGDTTLALTSSANWDNSGAKTNIIVWNYVDGQGFVWPAGTYSRNKITNAISAGSINTTTHVITLGTAWTGATIPAGTVIGQNDAGGTYMYGASNILAPTDWTDFGPYYFSGVHTSNTLAATTSFPQATAYVKMGVLKNYPASPAMPTATQKFANLSLIDVTAAADKVLKSGDTMTGTLTTQQIVPATEGIYKLGSTLKYWSDTYSRRFFVNNTAYIDNSLGDGKLAIGGATELIGPGNGIIMKSPNGTRYKLSIADGGTISITPA